MLNFLKSIPSWGKYLTVFVLIGSLIVWYQNQLKDSFDNGYQKAVIELQAEHNKLIAEQNSKYSIELQEQLDNYSEDLKAAKAAKDQYWSTKLRQTEIDLETSYNAKLKAERIKNESNIITGILDIDTVRLLNESRSQVNPPTYYESGTRADTGRRVNTIAYVTDDTLLSRFNAYHNIRF